EVLGGSNPLGVTFYVARGKPEERIYQIVGLVGNTKYRDLREQFQPIIFLAESQDAKPDADSTFVIRSGESAASLIAALKEVAERTSPEIVLKFGVLRTAVLRGMGRERLMATLSGVYGALAVGAVALVAVCARLIPAVRATAVQPVEVLREE